MRGRRAPTGGRGGAGRPRGPLLRGLRRLRAERDLTLEQLAEQTGRSRDTINRLENLRHGADERTVYALQRALGVAREELTGLDPDAAEGPGAESGAGRSAGQGVGRGSGAGA